jgi:Uma2 family endonuclease
MLDLAIEIISPSQSRREMREKADYYLRNGSKLVWIIYPDTRTVEACTWTGESLAITTLNDQAILTGGDLLPDFTLPISEIFPPKTDTPASE